MHTKMYTNLKSQKIKQKGASLESSFNLISRYNANLKLLKRLVLANYEPRHEPAHI